MKMDLYIDVKKGFRANIDYNRINYTNKEGGGWWVAKIRVRGWW